MSWINRDSVDEWRLFDDVLPVFLISSWRSWSLEQEDSHHLASAVDKASFENYVVSFLTDMVMIKGYRPERGLTAPEYHQCIDSLTSLLTFLENDIIKDDVVKASMISRSPVSRPATEAVEAKFSLQPSHVPTGPGGAADKKSKLDEFLKKSFISYATELRDRHVARTNPGGGGPATDDIGDDDGDDDDDDEQPTEWFPKLHNLGKVVRLGLSGMDSIHNPEPLLHCWRYINWQMPLARAERMKMLAELVKESFRSANPPMLVDEDDTAISNWDDLKPMESFTELCRLIGKRVCRDGHKIALRLDGFSMSNEDAAVFSGFWTLCPAAVGQWREGRYRQVCGAPKQSNLISDLCEHLRHRRGNLRVDILFTRESLWYQRHRPIGTLSRILDAYPTVSLAQLLERGALDDGAGNSRLFKVEDKAVLAFSLSICLLHFFRSLWMQDEWTADAIYFLHKPMGRGGAIFNIHYPYVEVSLSKLAVPEGERKPQRQRLNVNDCRRHLRAFARLLVEIDTGKRFAAQANMALHEAQIWSCIQKIKNQGRASYAKAVEGAFEFMKVARSSRAADPNTIRKIIYSDVVLPLQQNYLPYSGVMGDPRDGPFEIPRLIPSLDSAATLGPTGPVQQTTSMAYYDDFTREENVEHLEVASREFRNQFQRFRRHFIAPKMENRRNGRRRLKIAVLDTGVDVDDPWLKKALDEAELAREEEGFHSRDQETNPIVAYWPSEAAAEDGFGHGTYVAYLLLRYAPDADIYVAKISDGLTVEDYGQVAAAIDWAVGQGVDIINMSFGTQLDVGVVEQAISRASTRAGYPAIMFAAASNYGLNQPRAFPARDEHVICVHAFDGRGDPGTINPPRPDDEASLGTLGRGVKLSFRGAGAKARSGTSYATPILAAITANLIDWIEYHVAWTGMAGGGGGARNVISLTEYGQLRKVKRIRQMLREHMSEKKDDLYYVAPWILFPSNSLSEIGPDSEPGAISDEEKAEVMDMDWKILGALTYKIPKTA